MKAKKDNLGQASASEAQVPLRKAQSEPQADPWGIRRAEVLLTSLNGVLSARVVTTPTGEITEVHILTEPGLTPKQTVRNVESALLAQLGIKLDHRKISVAQTADVLPIEAMEDRAVLERARKRGGVASALQMTYLGQFWVCRANLHFKPAVNPAPPRPLTPEASTSSITSSGVISVKTLCSAL